MNQNDQPSKDPGYSKYVMQIPLFAIGGEVGCLTLLIVFVALFVGLGLDRLLGTKPAFTIVLLLGSAPIALALTFWVAMRAVKRYTPPPPASGQVKKIFDEEDNSD